MTSASKRPLIGLLAADGISATGNLITIVAVPWFVLQTTGSPARTGLVAFFATLPVVIAGPFGGVVIDRLGSRTTSMVGDTLSGSAVLTIALLHHAELLQFWHLPILVFLAGILDVPAETARSAVLPEVAEQTRTPLHRATSARSGVLQASTLIGGPIAGLLIATIGAAPALAVDAATFVIAVILVRFSVPPISKATRPSPTILGDLREGVRFLREQPLLKEVIAMVMFTNFLDQGFFTVLLPILGQRDFGGAANLGLAIGALGVGAVTTTIIYGMIGERLDRYRTIVTCFFIFGAPRFVILALHPPIGFAVAVMLATGLAAGPINPILNTALYERVPAELRGRVLGVLRAGTYGAMPLGALAAGLTANAFGLTTTLWIFAVLYAIGTLSLSRRRWRDIRPLQRAFEDPTSQDEISGDPATLAVDDDCGADEHDRSGR